MVNDPRFLLDLEIEDLHTVDHKSLIQGIVQGIRLAPTPFRVAIYGPWGSGKSTIMRLCVDAMTQAGLCNFDGEGAYFKPVWFNPWEHESDPNLLLSLVANLTAYIPDGVRYSRKGAKIIKEVMSAAVWLGDRQNSERRVLQGDALELLGEINRVHQMREMVRRFVDLTLSGVAKGRSRRLVVFVDDLDKCLPANVLSFLEALRLFAESGTRLTLVLALDRKVVAKAIGRKYANSTSASTEAYLEKIFEFSYTVPPVEISELSRVIQELYQRSGLTEYVVDPGERDRQLATLETVLTRPGTTLNPRKLKRIFNRFIWFFTTQQALAEAANGVDWEPSSTEVAKLSPLNLWLTWLLTAEYWPHFRSYAASFGTSAVGELCNRATGNAVFPQSNRAAREAFEQIPDRAGIVEYYRSIFSMGDASHMTEVQEEMRRRVRLLVALDRALRKFGI